MFLTHEVIENKKLNDKFHLIKFKSLSKFSFTPGQFVLFKYKTQVIVWPYDEERPALNTLYLPANEFQSDNRIHNIR